MAPLRSLSNHDAMELEALKESERRFRAIYEQAPIGMSLVDIRSGRFIEFNAKYCEITGRTPEELRGLTFLELTHPDDREPNTRKIQELQKGDARSFTLEKRYIRPGGSVVWVAVTVVPMWMEGTTPDFYVSLVEDISERKAVEAARLRQLTFERHITGILGRFASCTGAEIDDEIRESLRTVGCFIGAEEAFVSMLSPGLTSWSVIYAWTASGEDLCQRYKEVPVGLRPWTEHRIFSGGTIQIGAPADWPPEAAGDLELETAEGVKSLLILPLRGRGAQVRGTVGLRTRTRWIDWPEEHVRRLRILADAIANVMERKRIETALYDSRRMLQQILDTIPHRVFWKDLSLHYLGCNLAFARDLNLAAPGDILGKNDFELFGREHAERYRADDRRVTESGEPKMGYEELEPLPDGSTVWMRVSKVPLRDGQNRVFGLLGVAEDTRALRQARLATEQAKEAAEAANQAKDQFIAVLSHELRTPLTPVLAIVTAMEESGRLPGRWRSDLETIHQNVELEARLIDDLLDVTRISQNKLTLRMELLDAHACLRSTLEICEADLKAKRQELVLALEAGRPFVRADSARIRQVFWNLIKNAIKFTPEGGRIEIRSVNAGDRLKITVADNGIGIEPSVLPRIFDAFEQGELTRKRRFGGLGLGLSIARALVDMHHGTLSASSGGRDKGSLFTVELAAMDEPPREAPPVCRASPLKAGARRVLLVEDHEDTLRILARLLSKWGYEVTTAGSVAEAREKAREEPFDLLVSDLGLPDGSGLEIVRLLRGRVPGIALSGYGTEEDIRASLEAGFAEHLTKPVSFQTLRAAMEKLLVS